MGFTAILALFGVFAIAIPIVIHLNKAKQAPVVWVGNIRLLKGQDTKRFRPTNIDNWPLFILRVLIVLAITLAAAKPYRQGDYIDNQPLALVSPNWLVTASDEQIERISKQYDIAHLSWNALIHKNRLAHEQPTKAHHTNNLWALLSYYDEIQPQSQPFHVFVNDRLAPWFTQNRPEFSRELIWHIQVDDNPAQTPQAVIIADNRQLAGLSVLTEGLALLGYEVGFESTTSYKSNNKADVIFNLVNDIAINASHNNDSVIITGSKWLQGYQSVDFIFTLRQLIAAAYLLSLIHI